MEMQLMPRVQKRKYIDALMNRLVPTDICNHSRCTRLIVIIEEKMESSVFISLIEQSKKVEICRKNKGRSRINNQHRQIFNSATDNNPRFSYFQKSPILVGHIIKCPLILKKQTIYLLIFELNGTLLFLPPQKNKKSFIKYVAIFSIKCATFTIIEWKKMQSTNCLFKAFF